MGDRGNSENIWHVRLHLVSIHAVIVQNGSINVVCRIRGLFRPTLCAGLALDAHWGWDIGAWRLTRGLARGVGCGAVGGRWSRLVLDLNRTVTDETLVRPEAEGVELSWNSGLTPRDVERRIEAYHIPYHAEVDRLIARRRLRGVEPLLLAIHSFTPRLNGRSRPFDMGVLYEHHGDVARRLARAFRRSGLRVRYNQPYSGMAGMMYSMDRHGSHHRLPCLELEINQDRIRGSVTRMAGVLIAGVGEELARRSGSFD